MSIPYIQASIASVIATDGTFISYPFIADGDSDTKVYNMICIQRASDYVASQLELDATMSSALSAGVLELPFPADSNAFFVGDTNHTSQTGGMLQFTRTFTNIPQTINVPSGSELVTFPGIANGNLAVEGLEVYNGVGVEYDGFWVTTAGPHGLSVDDIVQVRNFSWNEYDETTGEFLLSDNYFTRSPEDDWAEASALEISSPTRFLIKQELLDWEGATPTLEVLSGETRNTERSAYDISNVSVNLGGLGVVITTSAVHTINTGEKMDINMQFTEGTNPFVNSVNGQFPVLSVPNNTSFIVDIGFKWDGFVQLSVESGAKVKSTGSRRGPTSYNTSTRTRYQYILPGVTTGIDDETDIVLPEPFKVMSIRYGEPTDITSDFDLQINYAGVYVLTVPTFPTSTDYIRMINNKSNIVIESTLSKWAGNIMVMKIKTCQAR